MHEQTYTYHAIVTKVVDGDTIDALVDLGFRVCHHIRFRLNGINTPELNSSDDTVREQAKQAKQYVVDRILDREVLIRSHKTDKYGRWLADVWVGDDTLSTLNEELVTAGLAERYVV